jgi:hypothetical protein
LKRRFLLPGVLAALAVGVPGDVARITPRESPAATAAAVSASGLPGHWCGEPNSLSATVGGGPEFQLVYAYPADRPNRFSAVADALQADASAISRLVAWQSGWTKTVRFDMGTSCGPQFVAIAMVALPGPRSAYLDPSTGAPLFNTVVSHLWGRLRPATGSRNLVVLADTLGGGGLAGIAGHSYDERPGADNASNDSGKVAMVFSDDAPFAADGSGAYAPSVFLHEMLHTIGAVNNGAPNSTRAGHCSDGADVMCLDDAGPAAATRSVCRGLDWTLSERVDCGGDDYFSPDPAPGSYLRRSWNVYRSVFLGSCWGELAAACGSDRGWAPPELSPASGPVDFDELGPVRTSAERGPARRQRTLTALRRVRSGRPFGWRLATVRARAFHDVEEHALVPAISVQSGSLRLPAGRWRIVNCVRVVAAIARPAAGRPRCASGGSAVLRRPEWVLPRGRDFSFEHRPDGMPKRAIGWVEVRRGGGGRTTLWATSLDRRRPAILVRGDG